MRSLTLSNRKEVLEMNVKLVKPKIKKLDDARTYLRLATILLTLLTAWFIAWAATGHEFIENLLQLIVLSYAVSDLGYNVYGSIKHRDHLKGKKEFAAKNDGRFREIPGEAIGTVFVLFILFTILMSEAEIWIFNTTTESAFMAMAITVTVISGSSIAKIVSTPKRIERKAHNSSLLIMGMATTAVFIVLLVMEAFGHIEKGISEDLLWTYALIIISYVAHNTVFSLACPNVKQRRPGHIAVASVIIFTVSIYILLGLGIAINLPRLLTPFFIFTMIILTANSSAKYLLETPLIQRLLHMGEDFFDDDPGEID